MEPRNPLAAVTASVRADEAAVVTTRSEDDLDAIVRPNVQAVVLDPTALPPWVGAVADAVRARKLQLERVVLGDATAHEVRAWADRALAEVALAPEVRLALREDVGALVDRVANLTGASRFMVRVHTDAPNRRCGFHVDTVVPQAAPIGILRVYNGPGTEYVEPDNVTSTRDFYRHLARRERLEAEIRRAEQDDDRARHDAAMREIVEIDDNPGFLRRPDEIAVVPAGSLVVFKHLPVHLHWSNHPRGLAWIHRSPMVGGRRLVVNVSPREARPRPRAAR